MRKDFIKTRDMMRSLFTGLPADMTVITFSDSRKTGGKVKKLRGAKLLWVENKEGKTVEANHIPEELSTRTPNHHLHGTMNLRLPNTEIMKVRKIFVKEFNGMEVVL